MATISLVAGNCGGGRGGEDGRFEFGPNSCFGKGFLASELLNSSFGRGHGYRSIGFKGFRNGNNGKRFHVIARIKKAKKHDYPWPDDIDRSKYQGWTLKIPVLLQTFGG